MFHSIVLSLQQQSVSKNLTVTYLLPNQLSALFFTPTRESLVIKFQTSTTQILHAVSACSKNKNPS